MGMATINATISAMKPSWKVTGRRAASSSATGVFCHSERPKSPCSRMPPIQRPYCSHIGLSRPSAEISCSRLTLSAEMSFWLSIRSMTLPGMRRTVTNTMRLAKNSVGISASRRRTM